MIYRFQIKIDSMLLSNSMPLNFHQYVFSFFRQEYLDDLYEIARAKEDPSLLESLENFLAATIENLQQKESENEKLDLALRR